MKCKLLCCMYRFNKTGWKNVRILHIMKLFYKVSEFCVYFFKQKKKIHNFLVLSHCSENIDIYDSQVFSILGNEMLTSNFSK